MKKYIIKAGGSGNIVETDFKHKIDWLNYRRIQINSIFFRELVQSLVEASKYHKIAYINGGVAAYLFINLAESLEIDKSELDVIGCEIINITSKIILEAVKKYNSNVCPELINPLEFEDNLFNIYNLIIFKAVPTFKSTDSLAAFVASRNLDSEFLLFKKGVPLYHVGFETPTKITEFKITKLKEIALSFNEIPGNNSIIDHESIELIIKNKIKTTLYNSEEINKLKEILDNKYFCEEKKTITFEDI